MDRGELSSDRGELTLGIFAILGQFGARPRKARLQELIEMICRQRDWATAAELAAWLKILLANLTERQVSPMVKAGQRVRRFSDNPAHAEQVYAGSGEQLDELLKRLAR